ncbi:MAG: hypothetical protein ACM337_04035, partial [Syntrophaceae bacterium]
YDDDYDDLDARDNLMEHESLRFQKRSPLCNKSALLSRDFSLEPETRLPTPESRGRKAARV